MSASAFWGEQERADVTGGCLFLDDVDVQRLDLNDSGGRTTFLVTHRIHALRRMDRILVLHRGRQVQWGTHEELIAVKGPYRRAARIQLGDALLFPPLAGGTAA